VDETGGIDPLRIQDAMDGFWGVLDAQKNQLPGKLDHFWMYVDRRPAPETPDNARAKKATGQAKATLKGRKGK
jgi:hypothetical protein